jgi:hypothetical protein
MNTFFGPTGGNTGIKIPERIGNTGNKLFGTTGGGNTGNKLFGPTGGGNTGNKLFGPTGGGNTGNKLFGPTGGGNTGNKLFGPTGGGKTGSTGNIGGLNYKIISNRYYDTNALGKTGNTINNVLSSNTVTILKSKLSTDIVTYIKNNITPGTVGFSYYSTSTIYNYTIYTKGSNYNNAISAGAKLKNKVGSPTSSVSYIISSIYNESSNLYS